MLESVGRTRVCLELTGAEEPISCPVTFSMAIEEWDATGIVCGIRFEELDWGMGCGICKYVLPRPSILSGMLQV